jgi:hypothetical protein
VILAPFRTNQTIGLCLLVGCFAFYLYRSRPVAGGLCAILLATQPWFTTYSRSSMSDLSGAATAAAFFGLIYLGVHGKRRGFIYAAAVVIGLSLFIRLQLIFLAPALVAMVFYPEDQWKVKWWTHCVLVLLVFSLAATPYFLFNVAEFGSPWQTGYNFWVPAVTMEGLPFSIGNFPAHLNLIWRELSLSRNQFAVANLFGTGTYIVPCFVILSIAGLPFIKSRRFAASALVGGLSVVLFTSTYKFVELRFYLPIFVLMVFSAVEAVEWGMRAIKDRRFLAARMTMVGLFGFSLFGYPSQSGWKAEGLQCESFAAIRFASSRGKSPRFEAQKRFGKAFSAAPGLVLSNIDPVYLNALLPVGFVSAPIDGHHSYIYSKKWHFGVSESEALARKSVSVGSPVYAFVDHTGLTGDKVVYPAVRGYIWGSARLLTEGFTTSILHRDVQLASASHGGRTGKVALTAADCD